MGSYNCCTLEKSESSKIKAINSTLKIIAEENRLRILCILREGKHCVCELMEHTRLSQSLISHHLKDLNDAGFVSHVKKKQWNYYSLTSKGKKVTNILFKLE